MEIVNKLIASLRELCLSMTPGGRISAGLLVAVVIVSVGLLFQQSQRDPDELLFGGEQFSRSQIGQIEAALASAGNDFRIVDNQIFVPRSKKDIYIAAVADADALPRNINSIMSDALQGGSFLDDHATRELRKQAARESQLSQIISLMPWVEQASVIFTIEEERGLRKQNFASATVNVLPRPGELLDGRRISNLKRVVAGWHPSLAFDKVTVTNLGDDSIGSSESGAQNGDEEFFKYRTACEQLKCESITKVLSHIPGVRVQVSANVIDAGETPNQEANGSKPPRFQEQEVFASIAVPRDYIVSVWKQLNRTGGEPNDEQLSAAQQSEISKIKNLVQPLLIHPRTAQSRANQIHVAVVNSIARATRATSTLSNYALAWTSHHWSAISIVGLASVGLLLLRSVIRNGFHSPEVADTGIQLELGESPGTESWNSNFDPSHSLKKNLAEFVRHDTEAAAAIMSNWIRNAS